ncbi:hypothetical protein SISNIDRAFT_467509 [Sistotremastrum niveocremeum HHB9708]|uniref:F-box domain-containing protein n=1 Tax=Sistotremastrum niveocremeum HHB9708 TaxID=1314777 RepID=A0A164SKH0_9AGAM|nr:hypothetical protein SISNIDRAFT_467509 [Sistotremastrum niveocremeum HHB9708]
MDTVATMTCSRVWEIPELISTIMSFLEVEDENWGTSQDFNALAVCAQFTQTISAAHWKRFRHYSPRIRSLVLHPLNFQPYRISHESTMNLLCTSPRGDAFLPSLRELSWDFNSAISSRYEEGELRWILFLLHDELKELNLTLPSHGAEILMDYLPMKAPNLERLVLWVMDVYPWSEFAESSKSAAVRAIRGLPLLRILHISADLVTPTLMGEIASRPDIQSNLRTSPSLSP